MDFAVYSTVPPFCNLQINMQTTHCKALVSLDGNDHNFFREFLTTVTETGTVFHDATGGKAGEPSPDDSSSGDGE